jgi:ubiquinone/menaquinone biosynthesis C-methylase UbiE
MSDTVERFSNRVANYVKYRPSYPKEILRLFRDEMNLQANSIVADVGSGTGISAKIFLKNGNKVYGVEPNAAMRAAAEEFLKEFPRFQSVDGTSENTNLPDKSVDFVIAAQAFHWFKPNETRPEFKRILRENGFVALIWNERQLDTNNFLIEYENLLKKFGTDYEKVRHDHLDEKIFKDFFQNEFSQKTFLNAQTVDFEGLKGRILSSSYMPSETDANYAPMIIELQDIFAKYAESGKIDILYNTNIFYTRI